MSDAALWSSKTLLELAVGHFHGNTEDRPLLTTAEMKLMESASTSGGFSFQVGNGEMDDPENFDTWGPKRTLRGVVIRWLLTDDKATTFIGDHGLWIIGARIVGSLDLSYANLKSPLAFLFCGLKVPPVFRGTKFSMLALSGSRIPGLIADGMKCEGHVHLNAGFRATGEVNLLGATIGGRLNCAGGRFENRHGHALSAGQTNVRGSVFLSDDFLAEGEVYLHSAMIGGQLRCSRGTFRNENKIAVNADSMRVDGSVFFDSDFHSTGEVRLLGTRIGGSLDCNSGKFENSMAIALYCDRMKVEDSVYLCEGFKATGAVQLHGARIGGQLSCKNGLFDGAATGTALVAEQMTVEGGAFLNGNFRADGEIRLVGATIGGSLECSGGNFKTSKRYAIVASGINVKGDVFLNDKFHARGELLFTGAKIGGSLVCVGGRFEMPAGHAMFAERMKVEGSIYMADGFGASGEVYLRSASIGGDLMCRGGLFLNERGHALVAEGLKVEGSVFLSQGFHAVGEVRLGCARIAGMLECSGGSFLNQGGTALSAELMEVGGSVLLSGGFKGTGSVRLSASEIGGQLNCNGGVFVNLGGEALLADGIKVGDSVSMALDFLAMGEVRLVHATIGGSLQCVGGTFWNLGGSALTAEGATVNGSVMLAQKPSADTPANGETYPAAYIFGKANFVNAEIKDWFIWDQDDSPTKAELDLREARIRTIRIGEQVGRGIAACDLIGLVYSSTDARASSDPEWWTSLLSRPRTRTGGISGGAKTKHAAFVPQPYEQAAAVLRKVGHEKTADAIMIAMENRRHPSLGWGQRWRHSVYGWTMGYGYAPLQLLWVAAALVVLAYFAAIWGHRNGQIVPLQPWGRAVVEPSNVSPAPNTLQPKATIREQGSESGMASEVSPVDADGLSSGTIGRPVDPMVLTRVTDTSPTVSKSTIPKDDSAKDVPQATSRVNPSEGYPEFRPLFFAVETFTPLIRLKQGDYWHVVPTCRLGWWLRAFFSFVTVFGWVITGVIVTFYAKLHKK